MATVAEQFPVQPGNNPPWYKSAPTRRKGREGVEVEGRTGWTNNPGYADPSYGVGDGEGNAFT